jgi:hypothetical protein
MFLYSDWWARLLESPRTLEVTLFWDVTVESPPSDSMTRTWSLSVSANILVKVGNVARLQMGLSYATCKPHLSGGVPYAQSPASCNSRTKLKKSSCAYWPFRHMGPRTHVSCQHRFTQILQISVRCVEPTRIPRLRHFDVTEIPLLQEKSAFAHARKVYLQARASHFL